MPAKKFQTAIWNDAASPTVWLGHSVRTTMLTADDPRLAAAPHMVSLGDAVHRPRLLDRVFGEPLKPRLGLCGPLMLDSGGFTLLGRPGGLDLGRLIEVCNRSDADFVIALDVPTLRSEKPATRAAKHNTTISNLVVMADAIDAHRLVPVVHGPTLREVAENAEQIAAITPNAPIVALGGVVPLLRTSGTRSHSHGRSSRLRHIARAIATVRSTLPGKRIHILGAGAPATVLGLIGAGADSVDSIGWRRAAGFGAIFVAGVGERFPIAHDRERQSRPIVGASERAVIAACRCPPCEATPDVDARLRRFAEKAHLPRAQHNAWTLLEEASAYRRALESGTERAWLEARLPAKWRLASSTPHPSSGRAPVSSHRTTRVSAPALNSD